MKILNFVFFIIMVLVNYAANILPLNNLTTGELSAKYPNLFVPTGLTFSIWGLIYILLFAFVFLQFKSSYARLIRGLNYNFVMSCILNSLWIFAWHYEFVFLSVLIMIFLLIILIKIMNKISKVPNNSILTKAVFGVYLGWICVAMIANVTTLLVSRGWSGWGISEAVWTIIMIIVGMIIASVTALNYNNPFVTMAVSWAFLGIIINLQLRYPAITAFAAFGILLTLSISIMIFKKTFRTKLL